MWTPPEPPCRTMRTVSDLHGVQCACGDTGRRSAAQREVGMSTLRQPEQATPEPSALGSRLGVIIAISAAAIGVIYGYDTGVIAGVLLFVPDQFHLSTSETSSIATAVALGMIAGALLA